MRESPGPATVTATQFAALFPFHIVFDRELRVTQIGVSHARLVPAIQVADHLPSLLSLERPAVPFTFETIANHVDDLFIARRHDGLLLRGQMMVLDEGRAVFLCSPWLPDPGGLVRWGLTLNDFPLHDAIPELVQVVQSQRIAVQDLQRLTTRLRQHREELRGAVQQAKVANQAKTHFLANVSHDLRTPLNTIVGMTSLLADAGLTDDNQELVQTVAASAEALLNSVGDLLDISKIETGQLTFTATAIDVAALCAEAADIVRTHIAAPVLLALVTPPSSLRVSGDPHRLRQVLVALLKHALTYTATGHVVMRAGWWLDEDQAQLDIVVEDTGPDIRSAERVRLLELFQQLPSSQRPAGTLGFGLTIARSLVEALGGTIVLENDPQGAVGCRFVVNLKLPIVEVGPLVSMIEGTVLLVADDREAGTIAEVCVAAGAKVERVTAADVPLAVRRAAAIIVDDIDGPFPPVPVPVIRLQRGGGGQRGYRERRLDGPLTPMKVRAALLSESLNRQRPATVQLGARVLLVDDNVDGERYARLVLARAGCVVTSAATADQALLAAGRGTFDVVLMDINLPDGSGIDAVQALRASERREGRARTPIICLTAHALRQFRDEAFAVGADDYVTKPVRAATLVEAVARACGIDVAAVTANTNGSAVPTPPSTVATVAIEAPIVTVAPVAMEIPVVDVDPDLADLIDGYLKSARSRIAAIDAALTRGDFEEVRHLGHSLRGTGSMYGFDRLTELGGELEDATRTHAAGPGREKRTPDVDAARKVGAALQDYVRTVRWRARPSG